MKAFFFKDLSSHVKEIVIDDDQVHHFNHVLRGKVGDKVLVLNGKGLSCSGQVITMKKKLIELSLTCFVETKRVLENEIAIGIPKKEYLAHVLRTCTEIGVQKVHLIKMEHSPSKLPPYEKIEKIMVSALIQSNSIYLPDISHYSSLASFIEAFDRNPIVVFSTESKGSIGRNDHDMANACPVIGPEGGFSENELNQCMGLEKVRLVHLPNPIMKTITAVPFCLGYLQF